jgi:hypothetical protein
MGSGRVATARAGGGDPVVPVSRLAEGNTRRIFPDVGEQEGSIRERPRA